MGGGRAIGGCAAALGTALIAAAASAASPAKIYDMRPMLEEPYPLRPGPWSPPGSVPAARPSGASAAAPAARSVGAAAPPGLAGREGFYVNGAFAVALPADAKQTGGVEMNSTFDTGISFAGAGGYAWRNGFRAEGEIWYQSNGVDQVTVANPGAIPGLGTGTQAGDGDVHALVLLANAAYDFDTGTRFTPYVVGGVGMAKISYSVFAAGGTVIADDSDWVMAFDVGIGVYYAITDNWAANVGFRYLWTLDPELRDIAGNAFDSEFATYDFLFGVRYSF